MSYITSRDFTTGYKTFLEEREVPPGGIRLGFDIMAYLITDAVDERMMGGARMVPMNVLRQSVRDKVTLFNGSVGREDGLVPVLANACDYMEHVMSNYRYMDVRGDSDGH